MPYGLRSNDLQPMVVYMKNYGSCSEQAALYGAILRSMLIPAASVGCHGEDHVWTEYWFDRNWYTFGEPIKMGTPFAETHCHVASVIRHWGNGFEDMVTDSVSNIIPGVKKGYTDTTELNIRVVDSLGQGIDGAMVVLRSHRMEQKYISHKEYTNQEGWVKFDVGLGSWETGVFVDVISPFGTGGFSKLIVLEGKKYNYTIEVPGVAGYYKKDPSAQRAGGIVNKHESKNVSYDVKVNFKVTSECQYPKPFSGGIIRKPDSEFTKEFGYAGIRPILYPNEKFDGIYVYTTDRKGLEKFLKSGIIESDETVERKIAGDVSRGYERPEDIAVIFLNKNSLRTYVNLEYKLDIKGKEQKPPEIILEKPQESAKAGDKVIFKGTCNDKLGISRLLFSFDNGRIWEDINKRPDRKTGKWAYEWESLFIAGIYQIKFRAENYSNFSVESPAVNLTLNPSNKINNIRIYQDNPSGPLPKSSVMFGPFKINPDEHFLDIESYSKENFDMDMFLFIDKNGDRILDGMEELLKKSDGPTSNEHIFSSIPSTTTVYWLYLHGCRVPSRMKAVGEISRDELLTISHEDFKKRYQYGLLDLEISFAPQPVIISDLAPTGVKYSDELVKVKGKANQNGLKSFVVELDKVDITKNLEWKGDDFSYKCENISFSEEITHTVKINAIAENSYEDKIEWFFLIRPKPDVTIDCEVDQSNEWLNITANVKPGIEVEYIKFKIGENGKWKNISLEELKARNYIWRLLGTYTLIVEYKTANGVNTIVKQFTNNHSWLGFGKQNDDIVIYPHDGMELVNSVAPLSVYLHKRIGEIKDLHVLVDEQEAKMLISDYAWGKVAMYVPEKPYSIGKHSVIVKVNTGEGKEIEKSIEFEIKPIK